MSGVIQNIILVFATLINCTVARNGCRQCIGNSIVSFDRYISRDLFKYYLSGTLEPCITGKQYEVVLWTGSDCDVKNCKRPECEMPDCKTWKASYQMWRYCGNGSQVFLDKKNQCVGTLCASDDRLRLKCNKSVDCVGTCECRDCGC